MKNSTVAKINEAVQMLQPRRDRELQLAESRDRRRQLAGHPYANPEYLTMARKRLAQGLMQF